MMWMNVSISFVNLGLNAASSPTDVSICPLQRPAEPIKTHSEIEKREKMSISSLSIVNYVNDKRNKIEVKIFHAIIAPCT